MKRLLGTFRSLRLLTLSVIALSSLASGLLTGCASVQMASQEQDVRAKTFKTNPSQANIYIYRNELFGAVSKMPVELDGKEIGQTTSKSYVLVSVNPGQHKLASKAENESVLSIMTEAGKNYFVWQEVKLGFISAGSKLQLVDATTGQAGVNGSELITISGAYSTKFASSSNRASSQIMDGNGTASLQKVEFRPGSSSVTVEKLAKQNNCNGGQGAGLLTPPGPIEIYRMSCEGGGTFMARCELRQCQMMK
ncbi:DUF2846 domain-containing protein [Undibacterium sp. 5I1]|uniref:DUF2846 domain-containing protein n=1 Tax=unclassified Undibacterium TaxID=2630295 RepID=UPI002AB4CA41|nr:MULTISPECIES: DUF2846 domain-containing protein [unclassified Undibacterium]MDY7536734.1 DUF2846 domain-containing protein [Undibacterium sp. 5I1]MEB0231888.1 DUF2846 domain-containing protein [Undibacterium sp. 10I3]MEB0256616.1 DUF2846 domain-containing protein [Undibacterium sp. 5I1]